MAPRKVDAVTASFHYLCQCKEDGGKREEIPFTAADFERLVRSLQGKPALDVRDEAALDKVRARQDAPIDAVEVVNDRTVFGRFYGSYWGHSYKNTHKGDISADSVSLRPFFFLLYLSDSGRIYISAQYLGTFGGYGALEQTIRNIVYGNYKMESHSFILSGNYYKNVKPKEIQVTLSDRGRDIAAKNNMGRKAVVVLKKASKNDGFEAEASQKILPLLGKSQGEVQKAIAELLKDSAIMDVDDAAIQDCTVIATSNGRGRTTIHMMEAGSHATRFPIDAKLDNDGHPDAGEAKAAMLAVLENEIIARG